jgi:nucleotide-binding universal stress UspA family protein
MPHPLGVLISMAFIVILGSALFWMLRLPGPMAQEVARAVYSVGSARCILVPVLELFYTERAVELACRLGRQQGAKIALAYIVEVPRLLTLDAPLPEGMEEQAQKALKHARSIVERHDLPVITTTVRAREVSEGISEAVKTYQADVIVLGIQAAEHRVPGIFTRTADALMRRPPCEVLIDSVPEAKPERGE